MDEFYVIAGGSVLLLSCLLQYVAAMRTSKAVWILPALYAIATFFLGLVSLLFCFLLIFIAQLYPIREADLHQKELPDEWSDQG